MTRILPLLAAAALFACDDGGGSSAFSSGIETSKTISSLTDAEGQQFCDAMERSFAGLISKQKACELASVFFTEDQQSCQAFTNQCVQAPPEMSEPEPEGFEEEEDVCLIAQAENREGCDETIETMNGCVDAVRDLARTNINKISCADAGNAEGLEAKFTGLPESPADVPGCESVATNCPKLFEEGGPMDMAMGEAMNNPE